MPAGLAQRFLASWRVHKPAALQRSIVVMRCLALVWLTYQGWRLLSGGEPIWPGSPRGAVDLYLRRGEVDRWFSDQPFEISTGVYPPASLLMLWPVIGWLPMPLVRVVWSLISLGCLLWLARFTVAQAGENLPLASRVDRSFLWWLPASGYAAGAGMGNGQHILHVLPMMTAAIFIASHTHPTWRRDMAAAVLCVGALMKPQLAAPFFWLFVFLPGRLRPAILAAAGYAALTAVALAFQDIEPAAYLTSLRDSVHLGSHEVRHADLGILLDRVGLAAWIPFVTFFVLIALGIWTWRNRHAELWVLLGVTALVTRFLMYHRWYDDLLLLWPMIALFRMATAPTAAARQRVHAGLLFVAVWLSVLAPGAVYLFAWPLNTAAAIVQAVLWLGTLVYLLANVKPSHPMPGR